MDETASQPGRDCPLCPRLAGYREALRGQHPEWHNAPVAGFGDPAARLAIVGLAPAVSGANRTGRPFTGDAAGAWLFDMLARFDLCHPAETGDSPALSDVFITNAVRCVPPQNKPEPAEIHACRPFLRASLDALPNLRVVLALGAIAHQSSVKALGGKLPKTPFAHGAVHRLHSGYSIVDSYHCSRLNTNTGRLTEAMFAQALAQARDIAFAPG